jgi:hypothetical protein
MIASRINPLITRRLRSRRDALAGIPLRSANRLEAMGCILPQAGHHARFAADIGHRMCLAVRVTCAFRSDSSALRIVPH